MLPALLLSPSRPFFRIFIFAMIGLHPVLIGCGGKTKVVKVKDYRMTLAQRVLSYEGEFIKLINEFNRQAAVKVLSYTNSTEEANSPLIVTKGLKVSTGGKIGLGQWIAEMERTNPSTFIQNDGARMTINYSMRLEFDADYLSSRMGTGNAAHDYEKQKLFFHEVGHGLEMDHNPNDPGDVMYPDVDGPKDFEAFFEKVRSYLRDT